MTTEPVGLSNDLAPQQVMRAIVGAHDIAVWRSASGVINAWENRCPHRGMRLSHGFVRGESLACVYHGWHYNTEGYCHYIPAHPQLTPPKTVRPVSYSVVENCGLIWVDANGQAEPVPLPDDVEPVRSLTFNCEFERIHMVLSEAATTLSDAPLVVTLSAGQLGNGAVVACQQPQPGRVVAHLLARRAVDVDERIALSQWLESLRRFTETPGEQP